MMIVMLIVIAIAAAADINCWRIAFCSLISYNTKRNTAVFHCIADGVGDVLPLDHTRLRRLDNSRRHLVQLIDCDDAFITDLANHGCITWPQRHELRDTRKSRKKNGKLIDFLRRRSIADYNKFAQCLAQHHQLHLVQLLHSDGGSREYVTHCGGRRRLLNSMRSLFRLHCANRLCLSLSGLSLAELKVSVRKRQLNSLLICHLGESSMLSCVEWDVKLY